MLCQMYFFKCSWHIKSRPHGQVTVSFCLMMLCLHVLLVSRVCCMFLATFQVPVLPALRLSSGLVTVVERHRWWGDALLGTGHVESRVVSPWLVDSTIANNHVTKVIQRWWAMSVVSVFTVRLSLGPCTTCPRQSERPCLCGQETVIRPCADAVWQCNRVSKVWRLCLAVGTIVGVW